MPKISVILPVYNAEGYLYTSIGSILNQTLSDFELLVINDGSTDRSAEVVDSIKDPRIRFFNNQVNQGTATVSNTGLEHATGKYIALMDADDFSFPDRFEKQVRYLDDHAETGILGTASIYSNSKAIQKYSAPDEELRVDMFFFYPFRNPSMMLRNSIIQENNLRFDRSFKYTLDYEFISRMIAFTRTANLTEPLLMYRVHDKQITTLQNQTFLDACDRVRVNMLHYLGIEVSEEERKLHCDILNLSPESFGGKKLEEVSAWLNKIGSVNSSTFLTPKQLYMLKLRLHPVRRQYLFTGEFSVSKMGRLIKEGPRYWKSFSPLELGKIAVKSVRSFR